jgi:PAS domain S-box-containing protein
MEVFMKENTKTQEQLETAKLRKKVEDQSALLADYSRFKSIVDTANHGCAILDMDGRIVYTNEYFARIHGYTPEELKSGNFSLLHTDNQSIEIAEVIRAIEENGKCIDYEIEHKRRDGTEFTVQMSVSTINDENGKPKFVSAYGINIENWKLNQKASALHVKFLKNLNLIDEVLRKSAAADQMMSDVLQVVLDLFQADRAWLLFPCDPEAGQWSIPMEIVRPGYPGAKVTGKKYPMTVEMKNNCRKLLEINDVATIDSRDDILSENTNRQFSILSQMLIPIHPKTGKPWIFGLHQCSEFREWTTEEKDLFREISHRISDSLSTMLLVRDLRESEEKFRYLADTSMEAIFFTRNGVCLEANKMAAKMFGWESPESFTGRVGYEVIAPESWEMVRRNLQNEVSGPYEAVGLRKDGSKFPIIVHARSMLYKKQYTVQAVSVMDISRQRETENLLRQSRKRAESYLNIANTVFVALDTEGTITLVNKKACDILGRDEQHIIGKNWFSNFLPESIRDQVKKIFLQLVSGKLEMIEYFENPIIAGDGTERLIAWHNAAITDSEGNLTGLLSSGQDITVYRKAAQEKRDLEIQMQHTQKLESLGVLAGGIAHDFNNILMAILGNTNIALMDLSPENPVYSNIKAVETAAKGAADLAKQMLAYSGRGKFLIEAVNLNDAVDEMTRILEVSISKNAELEYRYAHDLPLIEADATQIKQVIMNLVTNASDAVNNSPGSISITTGVMYCDAGYLASTYINESFDSGRYVYLEVTDTGCGMDQETLKKLFDPFYSTKFTGRGLGLSAVLGIIRGHKGAIKVYSEPGIGTSIKVLFPARSLEQKPHIKEKQKNRNSWTGSGTILLIDDEEAILSVGKQMLEHLGFHVVTASDGAKAVKIYRESSDTVTLVILDYIMPHLDGKQTFRELCRIREDVQVIMCSGYNKQEVIRSFTGRQPAGFLHKPYIFKELISVLQRLINNSPIHDESEKNP